MINFEFERKAFNDWHLLKYGEFVNWWDDTPASWIHNDRWEGWKSCAESKQAEIDSMKAQLSKVESGEYVVVPKSSITQFWQDDEEPENFVNKERDFDCLGDCIDIDGIMQINKHHQAHIKTEKLYGTWIAKNDDGMLIRDLFHVGTYEECLAIVAKNKAMIEGSQEQNND